MTGGIEDREGGKTPEQVIVVEGPVLLSPGQDFYDQPPFDDLVERFSGELAIDHFRLTTAITRLIKPNLNLEESIQEINTRIHHVRHDVYKARNLFASRPGNMREGLVFLKLLEELDPYPQWPDYIRAKHDHYLYRPSGKYHEAAKLRKFPPTYFTWLQETQARQGRLAGGSMIRVVGETFPQQQLGKSTAEAVMASGARGRRRWELRTRPPR